MFAWFTLCFWLQLTCLSLLFLYSTQLENGILPGQVVLVGEYYYLEQNVVVVLYQITQLAVFPFVEFVRALTKQAMVAVGCVSCLSSLKAGNSDSELSSL